MKRRGIELVIAAVFLIGGCGENELTVGTGGAGGDNPNPVSCGGDPDHPDMCTYWTCMTVPTQYGNKTHCTATNPTGGQPSGSYTCPESGGGLYCPGPGAGGSGPWTCTATEFSIDCERSGGGTSGSTGGSSGSTGGSGGTTGTGGSSGGSGGTGGSGGDTSGTGGTGGSGGVPGFSCSYAMVVFYYNGQGPYIIKIGTGGCTDENMTSSDANFSYTCNGVTYDNNNSFVVSANGTVIQPWTGSPSCSSMFNITNTSVTAVDPAVTIVFGVAHRGSFPNHFAEYCGGSPINYQCGP
jgi:hypothetical protein